VLKTTVNSKISTAKNHRFTPILLHYAVDLSLEISANIPCENLGIKLRAKVVLTACYELDYYSLSLLQQYGTPEYAYVTGSFVTFLKHVLCLLITKNSARDI
jgi:hypothetical protein